MLVDTALVLPHGRVIRALSLLRLSSLAPCQRARRLLSLSSRAVLTAPCFPDIFPFGEPNRTEAPKAGTIPAVCEMPFDAKM